MNLDLHLFRHYWHAGCHRRELQNDGDFVRFDCVIGEVVLFNDGGEIVAFDNRCPHRGARLYTQDAGNRSARCDYHGWAYRHGTLIVPERQRFHACDIEHADLNRYTVDWCGDFAFFAVAPCMPLYEQLGTSAVLIENISFNVDRRIDLNRYDFECYWPIAVENALEPYHISAVHPESLGTLQLGDGHNVCEGLNSVWYAPLGNARIDRQLDRLRKLFNIDYQYNGYMSVYLFPFSMVSSTFGYSYSLQNFLPDAQRQRAHFTSRLYTANVVNETSAQVLASFFESTVAMNRRVFDEDHAICRNVPADSWSCAPLRYASDLEVKIDHFRRACRTALGQGHASAGLARVANL